MTLSDTVDWPRSRYDSRINNIVTEFFIPALKESTTYRRIGGFFSSTSIALAARGINEMIENEGKMQLVISPILTKEDSIILNNCPNDKRDEIIHKSISNSLDLTKTFERNHVAALAYLLKKGFLEIKIDIQIDRDGRYVDYDTALRKNLLDEKLGIFQDREGNVISFRGPVNENKQNWEHGIFEITVDVDWIDGQRTHVIDDIHRFQKKWEDSKMLKLPQKTKEMLIKNAPSKISELDLAKFNVPQWAMLPNGNILWDHQIRAVNSWLDAKNRGIFNIATSGGKTLAALVSASLTPVESIVLILVPTMVLTTQWEKEIREFTPNVDLVVCDSDHSNWDVILPGKLSRHIANETVSRKQHLVILATMKTAISEKFRNNFENIPSKFLMVIADEVHHLGAPKYSMIFEIDARKRLGLSATFERDWDEIGTNRILNYFGKPIDEIYTVADGIREGKLSRYEYHPFFAYLNNEEFLEHVEYSKQIKKTYSQLKSTKDPSMKITIEQKYERLLMNRAQILKKTEDKIRVYGEILKTSPKKPYIVFADDNDQVIKLKEIHKKIIYDINRNKQNNFEKDDIMIFSGKLNNSERNKILEESKNNKTPLFAMYCLDEGVDVPEFQSAILISSYTSKRQYIQRRGRILRTSAREKIAHLYDIIVFPNPDISTTDMEETKIIVSKEKERVMKLSQDAVNKWNVDGIFNKKLKDIGFIDLDI